MTFVLVNENKGDKINNTVNNKAEERGTFALFKRLNIWKKGGIV